MRHGGALQISVNLLDDGVPAEGLVRRDGVEVSGVGGGEEAVEPPGVEQTVAQSIGHSLQHRVAGLVAERVGGGVQGEGVGQPGRR